MKMRKLMAVTGMSLVFVLTSCRSRQEAAGDKYRKAGDAIHALQFYEEALKRGKTSREFWKNYTQVNIQCLAMRAKEDPTAEFLNPLKDTILSLLRQYPDPANEALFAQALTNVGIQRLNSGDEEGGVSFLEAAEGLPGKPAEVTSQVQTARQNFLANKLKEIEGDYKESATEPTAGIVADYKLNQLQIIFGKELPEMKDLWSKVRKTNLNTYLMYDLEGLLPSIDARINKYGVLLGIVKLQQGPTSLNAQVTAFNGGSGPIHFTSQGFTLVDREGKVYKPASAIGAFKKNDPVPMRETSKTGGLTFNYPSGTQPYYLEFRSEAGLSRKYLP